MVKYSLFLKDQSSHTCARTLCQYKSVLRCLLVRAVFILHSESKDMSKPEKQQLEPASGRREEHYDLKQTITWKLLGKSIQ